MRECQIESQIAKKARDMGFLSFKFSSPSNRGVPDRMFISETGKIFFIEFKSKSGKLTPLQQNTHQRMGKCNVDVFVINEIEEGFKILQSYNV